MSLSYYQTIDEFLGSGETRYFGGGYLNTEQILTDFSLTEQDGKIEFQSTGMVVLPEIWSAKGSGKQKPHLSSIDAIEFAVACLGEILKQKFPGSECSIELIERINVVAGKEPVEDTLDAIPLRGILKTLPDGHYAVEMSISNMKVTLACSAQKLKNGFKLGREKQPVVINDLMLNQEGMNASAIVSSARQNASESWALSSCFASALQMGQVLLYKLDSLTRDKSHTLWMRRMSIGLSPGIPALGMAQPIYTRLNNVKKLRMDGADWRCADIFSIMCNTNIVCSVAHRL
jgi:hypothetical protein